MSATISQETKQLQTLAESNAVQNPAHAVSVQKDSTRESGKEKAITVGAVVIGAGFLGASVAGGIGTMVGVIAGTVFALIATRN